MSECVNERINNAKQIPRAAQMTKITQVVELVEMQITMNDKMND